MATAPSPAAAYSRRSGTVASFDDTRGAGEIIDEDGKHRWPFHCTRIAGGSRTIEVGSPVTYRAEPGPTGLEAVEVAQR